MGKGFFVAFAQEEIGRVRRKHKRLFLEAEEFGVHLRKPSTVLNYSMDPAGKFKSSITY